MIYLHTGPKIQNISDLFLRRIAKEIGEGSEESFEEATNLLVMVMVEFDEDNDLVDFLQQQLTKLERKRARLLLHKIMVEIFYLPITSTITSAQGERIKNFIRLSIPLREAYNLAVEYRGNGHVNDIVA